MDRNTVLFGGPTLNWSRMSNNKATAEDLYRYHTENLRALKTAKGQIAPLAKAAIATQSKTELSSLLRLYAFLVGAWAEVRLQKVLYEPTAFTDAERTSIRSIDAQLEQWKRVVEVAFRKHYAIAEKAALSPNLNFTARARYEAIIELLNSDLKLVITVRNRLAHGQWAYALTSSCDAVENNMMKELKQENFLSLQFKDDLIGYIAELINTLVVSQATFERDFDKLYKKMEQIRINLHRRKYSKYATLLITNHQRGRATRRGHDKTLPSETGGAPGIPTDLSSNVDE
ncbi:hypothetical protein [Paraburkholderia fungorum]|uniref:hypothetical protein n=1 Tax=Paraburkholderia fungorum TaxID=134537 RepID=UPI001C1EC005|nr:hypothetical protein [Paraburkholderia fungorum]MBU7438600.1 hypothetical protein [Paraburkholderia fungorum]